MGVTNTVLFNLLSVNLIRSLVFGAYYNWLVIFLGVVTLDIYKCHQADNGVYEIVVKNYCGELSDKATLEVTQNEFRSSSQDYTSRYAKKQAVK